MREAGALMRPLPEEVTVHQPDEGLWAAGYVPTPRRGRSIDRLAHRVAASAEWLFVIYAFVLMSGANLPPTAGSFELDPAAPTSSSLFAPIYLLAGLISLARPSGLVRAATAHRMSLALLALAVCSIAWSDGPDETIRRSIAIAGTYLFAWYLVSRFPMRDIVVAASVALGFTAVLSLYYIGVHPDIASIPIDEGSWRGIYENKNVLGRAMVLSSMMFLLLTLEPGRRRWPIYLGLGASTTAMLLSQSKTALLVLIGMGLLFRFSANLRLKATALVPVLILTVVVIGGGAVWVHNNAAAAAASVGKDATLTGRTDLWKIAIHMIQQRPFLGFGLGGFWRGWSGPSAEFWVAIGWPTPHSHNGFLDLALDLGWVGVAVFVAGLITALASATVRARAARTIASVAPLMLISYVVLYNITESSLLKNNTLFWVLFVVASSVACGGGPVEAMPASRGAGAR